MIRFKRTRKTMQLSVTMDGLFSCGLDSPDKVISMPKALEPGVAWRHGYGRVHVELDLTG